MELVRKSTYLKSEISLDFLGKNQLLTDAHYLAIFSMRYTLSIVLAAVVDVIFVRSDLVEPYGQCRLLFSTFIVPHRVLMVR